MVSASDGEVRLCHLPSRRHPPATLLNLTDLLLMHRTRRRCRSSAMGRNSLSFPVAHFALAANRLIHMLTSLRLAHICPCLSFSPETHGVPKIASLRSAHASCWKTMNSRRWTSACSLSTEPSPTAPSSCASGRKPLPSRLS